LRTEAEQQEHVGNNIEKIFLDCGDSVETKLENFPKYVRIRHLKRFLALYEIFKLVLPVKGSVVECGVYRGFGLMAWAKISSILEVENTGRRIYGFDTFDGFPSVNGRDQSNFKETLPGELRAKSFEELGRLVGEYDSDRWLGHIQKVELIQGDMLKTIPEFVERQQHVVVSLLSLDCDLHEPTKVAIQHFLPRMPKGAVIVFDELDKPIWPGETMAVLETIGIRNLRIRRSEWFPYLSYAVLE
jgi:hypothetical protein